ncbi:hypothetical protein Tco_1035657, partial [Tanacetum coccineum]
MGNKFSTRTIWVHVRNSGDNNDEYVDMNLDVDGVNDTDVEDVNDVNLGDDDDGVHVVETNVDNSHVEDVDVDISVNIFDPRNWDTLSFDMIKVLVAEGMRRDKPIEK